MDFLYLKGDGNMMAIFFMQRIIFGKTAFNEVPTSLQSDVKEILDDSGGGFLTEQ